MFQYAKESEMKEMLGNLAEGQIEFYKAVSLSFYNRFYVYQQPFDTGNGGMGENYTNHSTDSSGRLIFNGTIYHLLF